jgi:hypothetical protein
VALRSDGPECWRWTAAALSSGGFGAGKTATLFGKVAVVFCPIPCVRHGHLPPRKNKTVPDDLRMSGSGP